MIYGEMREQNPAINHLSRFTSLPSFTTTHEITSLFNIEYSNCDTINQLQGAE